MLGKHRALCVSLLLYFPARAKSYLKSVQEKPHFLFLLFFIFLTVIYETHCFFDVKIDTINFIIILSSINIKQSLTFVLFKS